MLDAFHLGGWGMYPTTLAGLMLFIAAVQYARQPDQRRMRLVHQLTRLTFLVSCLGFVTGVIKSFIATAGSDLDVGRMVVGGVGESLANIGLGLTMLVVAAIVTSVGTARAPVELANPRS